MVAEEDSSKRGRIYVSASASLGSSDSLLPGISDDVALICLARVPTFDYPSLCCVNKKYNKLIKSGHLLALRKNLGIVEYLVFMVCHHKDWVMFSPMQNKWLMLPKIPNDECLIYRVQASLAVDGELLVIREEVFKSTIWKFSLRSGCWVKCQDMHYPRKVFASGSLDGIAIVAGGIDTNWNLLASAELYDSSTGRWEMLPNMHTPKSHCSGFFMDGKFYVIGGISNCGEEFDLETKKWRRIEGMYPNVNRSMESSRSFAVVNDELYTLEYRSYIVKKYDKANNKWETMGRFPPMVDSIWGMDFKACGDQLFVFCKKVGGGNGDNIVVYSWCPKSGDEYGQFDLKVVEFKDNFDCFTVMGC